MMKQLLIFIKVNLLTKKEKELSAAQQKVFAFLNRISLLLHVLLSLAVVFLVEWISRRSFFSAAGFVGSHTLAYLYNSFIVFVTLFAVYLFRRRAFARIVISGFWLILGIINGCVLSNRVTPFGFTDLKCIGDLFAMTNTSYFTATEAMLIVVGGAAFLLFCVIFFIKGPRYRGSKKTIALLVTVCALSLVGIPVTTQAAQSSNVLASYFANIAQGYENYGFIYGFSSSVVGVGMSKPSGYHEETILSINEAVSEGLLIEEGEEEVSTAARDEAQEVQISGQRADHVAETERTKEQEQQTPNIILILLESFCDPEEIKIFTTDRDPIPTFHYLQQNYSTGYLTVPVVGAGTANTEFEILTGMSMQYFGTGEYPYKTIFKKIDSCESVSSDLSAIGYGTHAVHNNGGNFYSRVNSFSLMGFDTFSCKETMDIVNWTPLGSWAADDILVSETIKTLDATPDQPDFTYTITVGTHGDYPTEEVLDSVLYPVKGLEDEGEINQWNYYVNQLHECDKFLQNLIRELADRDEDTLLIAFGDHLPTMGLTDEDMVSGDIYKTQYVTWNNFGMEKEDADLYAYQLMAEMTDRLNIHEGTILTYHQTQKESLSYQKNLENLQYDLLYGKRYSYGGQDPYPATDITMGIDEVKIRLVEAEEEEGKLMIYGTGFTNWSKVYVNGTKVKTTYLSGKGLSISLDKVQPNDVLTVCQVGSSNTIFRSSQDYVYERRGVYRDEETTEEEGIAFESPIRALIKSAGQAAEE